ncbi:MAG: response regulator [Lachnospiraceae bacterium]
MRKVIIADDEYFSRKALVKMLGKQKEIEVCCEAESGIDVLEYLEDHAADILITDIRMPEMDGLELIKRTAQEYPHMKVIVVSGYADFRYAQNAMRWGVREYLTKPVKVEELNRALQNMIQQMKENELQDKEQVKSNALKYLKLVDVLNQPELGRMLFQISDDIQYQLMVLQTEKNSKLKMAYNLVQGYDWKPISVLLFERSKEVAIFLRAESESEMKKNELQAENFVQMAGKMNLAVYIAGSGVCTGFASLPLVYEELVRTMNERLTVNRCQYYKKDSFSEAQYVFFSNLDTQMVYDGVLSYHYQRAWEPINRFLNQIEGTGMYSSLCMGLQKIFLSLAQACHDRSPEHFEGSYEKIFFNLDESYMYQFRNLDEIRVYLDVMLQEMCQRNAKHTGVVDQIKEFVELHYQEPITLNSVAQEHFFMNASYVSRIFKESTGMAFSKYLTEVRMSHAKDLLKNTGFRVNDIAGYVGYNDVSYFIQTFKKITGMTPEQYRQENME